MSIFEEFFSARNNFEQVIEKQSSNLVLVEETLNKERCPSREELAPILNSVQLLSVAVAEFLGAIGKAVSNSETKLALEKMPLENAMPDEEALRKLMAPRHLIISLVNSFYKNDIGVSSRWEHTYELVIWYSEYRNTVSSLFYIVQNYNHGYMSDTVWLWDWLKTFLVDQLRIDAFRYIAQRAIFLESVNDHELESGEVTWWCQKIDSFPKKKEYYDIILGLLNHCPNSKNQEIAERLKDLSLLNDFDDNNYYSEQLENIRNKALTLLNI